MIDGCYTQVSDTSHGCHHEEFHTIVDDGWSVIQCVQCLKRWKSLVPTREKIVSMATVLDEVHDFQRFERVMLNRSGGVISRELKIVCCCGWSHISLDNNPDEAVAIAAARTRLQAHVDDAIAYQHHRPPNGNLGRS